MSCTYVYLHGFSSGPGSAKAAATRQLLARHGVDLLVPDLNVPSFADLTVTAALGVVDELLARHPGPFRVLGSSMGGWIAARVAELHPDRIERAVLLCPGFDMAARWPEILGWAAFARWRRNGRLDFPDERGNSVAVGFRFYEDAAAQPGMPEVACPALVIHGTRDLTVPIGVSRAWVGRQRQARLVEVDDDHALAGSLGVIGAEVVRFFGLVEPAG